MSKKTIEAAQSQDIDLGQVYTRTELILEKNKKPITYGAIGLLVVVAAILGYKKLYAEPRATEAAELIWKAQYYFEIDSLNKALNGDDLYPGFISIASDYGDTPSGKLAHYYLGSIYMQQEQYQMALDSYKEADVDDDVLRVMAVGNQGDVLTELGRTDEAIGQFEKAANMVKSDYTTPMFLMKAGVLYRQKNDHKNAAKCFGRIATDFPTSPDVQQAKKYAAYAESMSGQG